MKNIFEFIEKIPVDVKQATYSLTVSALLIVGALFMLDSYLDTIEEKPDVEVSATSPEEEEQNAAP